MLYKKIEDEAGEYVDAQGCRFTVQSARRVRTAEGVNVGYMDFPSMKDALAAWGLRDSIELCSASDELTPMYSRTYESRE